MARTVAVEVEALLCRRFGEELGKTLAAMVGIGRDRAVWLATAQCVSDETMSTMLKPKLCCALRNAGVFWKTIEAIETTKPVAINEYTWALRRRIFIEEDK